MARVDPDVATLDELRVLADQVRSAQDAQRTAISRRDAAITAAFAAGVSPTKIARHLGLDRQLVYRISKRARQPAPSALAAGGFAVVGQQQPAEQAPPRPVGMDRDEHGGTGP